MANQILVVGIPDAGKTFLTQQLTKSELKEISADVKQTSFRIETKYYIADTIIDVYYGTPEDIQENLLKDVQALLFVYESGRDQEALLLLKSWKNKMEQLEIEPAVQLVLVNSYRGLKSTDLCDLWCNENGFEPVVVTDLQSPGVAEMSVPTSSLLNKNEMVGLERVWEALTCHMWPEMNPVEKSLESEEHVNTDVSKDHFKQTNSSSNDVIEVDEQMESLDPLQEMIRDIAIQGEEQDVDHFENLFSEIQMIRSQAGTLSDKERRERAAKMMEKLMKLDF